MGTIRIKKKTTHGFMVTMHIEKKTTLWYIIIYGWMLHWYPVLISKA